MIRKIFFVLVVLMIASCQSMAITSTSKPTQALELPSYEKISVSCEVYIETTWGNEKDQWGDPAQTSIGSHGAFPPLVFNEGNDLFLIDYANLRILKYDGVNTDPAQVISLPDYFASDQITPPWGIIVRDNKIYIPHSSNRISILSTTGQELSDIEVPYYYNMMAPGSFPILVDSHGRLLVKSDNSIYFDIGWEEGNWKEIAKGRWLIHPFLWDKYIGDMDSVLPKVQLYDANPKKDFLLQPVDKIDFDINATYRFLGIDQDGQLYFQLNPFEAMNNMVVRYSIPNRQGAIGVLASDDSKNIVQANVAPNGTMYLVAYDEKDISVEPKMLKCNFP